MRDKSKNEKYYEEYIAQQTGRIAKFESKIAYGTVASDRVGIIRAKIDSLRYSLMVAKYSNGTDLDDIRQDYIVESNEDSYLIQGLTVREMEDLLKDDKP